ncbi:MAG: hypothetical protein RMK29_18415 [Myxococcales bacterium]|nr:hypothetical protein [Myxococcota bacterium]MDW8283683.1 hypothetical protein [Myxococcales bacterium]
MTPVRRFYRETWALSGADKALLLCVALAVVLLAGALIRHGSERAASDAKSALRGEGGELGRLGRVVDGPQAAGVEAPGVPAALGALERFSSDFQAPPPPPEPPRQEAPGLFGQVGGFFKGLFEGAKDTVVGLWELGKSAFKVSPVGWLIDPQGAQQEVAKWGHVIQTVVTNPSTLWDAIKQPYVEAWHKGRYGEAIGRGAFELLTVVLGTKGVDKLARGGQVAGKLDDVGRLGNKLDDLGRAGGKLDDIGKLIDEIKGSIKNHPLRQAYERDVARLAERAAELERSGMSLEDIARTLHKERRELGIRYKDVTPQPLRDYIYEINMQRYGDPLGPSFDYLVRKHTKNGVTDYRAIIEGASRPNPDVDRLLAGFEEWLRNKGYTRK